MVPVGHLGPPYASPHWPSLSWILRLESRKVHILKKKGPFLVILVLFGAKLSLTPRHLRETHRRMVENGMEIRGDLKLLMNYEKKHQKCSQNFWSKKIFKVLNFQFGKIENFPKKSTFSKNLKIDFFENFRFFPNRNFSNCHHFSTINFENFPMFFL